MTLDELLAQESLSHVTSNSRDVKPGTIFVAVKGESRDGHQFIGDAARAGASAIVGEIPKGEGVGVPYVQVPDSREALAYLASKLSGEPSRNMLMIGVTGTSGKTTTTYLIESILAAAGHRVGVIGTVNFRWGTTVLESTHTTPGPVELQALLARMYREGCTAVVMEVSSHALAQRRADFIAFDGMVFNNLSREHLDFHKDMDDYFRAKLRLFTDLAHQSWKAGKNPIAAVNVDDEWGRKLAAEMKFKVQPFGLGHSHHAQLHVHLGGIDGKIGHVQVRSWLTGRFNAYNLLGAVTICHELGVRDSAIEEGVRKLELVPGRLERVANERGVHVLVDYAHKPDALEKVLETLREVREPGRKIITVFGCGGDRDRTKRPVMGEIACRLSDQVFITSDNPRREKPEAIIEEIVAGARAFANYRVEADRRKAIFAAIAAAGAGDVVLIAGKGHEDYQIIADPAAEAGTRKIHFDDREVARDASEITITSPSSTR